MELPVLQRSESRDHILSGLKRHSRSLEERGTGGERSDNFTLLPALSSPNRARKWRGEEATRGRLRQRNLPRAQTPEWHALGVVSGRDAALSGFPALLALIAGRNLLSH